MRPLATGILKPFTIRNRANRAKGLCQCGREPVQGKACCASCREKYRSYQGRLKAQVIVLTVVSANVRQANAAKQS